MDLPHLHRLRAGPEPRDIDDGRLVGSPLPDGANEIELPFDVAPHNLGVHERGCPPLRPSLVVLDAATSRSDALPWQEECG